MERLKKDKQRQNLSEDVDAPKLFRPSSSSGYEVPIKIIKTLFRRNINNLLTFKAISTSLLYISIVKSQAIKQLKKVLNYKAISG